MSYRAFQPAVDVAEAVECYWALRTGSAGGAVVPPDGRPEIIFHLGEPSVERLGDRRVVRPRYAVCGQLSRGLRLTSRRASRLLAIRLQPWALAGLFDVASCELTDTSVELEAVAPSWGRELIAIAEEGAGVRQAVRRLEASVRRRLRTRPAALFACPPAVRALERTPVVDLRQWAALSGTSLRTWQRRFQGEIGISPKLYARIARFLRWLALARGAAAGSLAERALAAGYFDQSHVHRDARQFAGTSPAALLGRDLARELSSYAPLYNAERLNRIWGALDGPAETVPPR